jgi:hypothetical protein
MKAHSGTPVPSGTEFEYLSPFHQTEGQTSKTEQRDERLWRVDGSAVVGPRFPANRELTS